ncbi:Pentatricopeptide repeat-containing protein, partial [Cucurbita argyrosperma subsp. argyrosperma]
MRHGIGGFVAMESRATPTLSRLADLLLVASITKTLSESGTRTLQHQSLSISEPLLLQILRSRSVHPSNKLDFFKWCSLSPNFSHSPSTYSQIFRILCRSGYLHEVPLLLSSMKRDGVDVDVDSHTFKVLLDAFIRSGKFDAALEILDHMEELGTSLELNTYNSVLVALVRKNQVGLALSIFFKLFDAFSTGGQEGSAVPSFSFLPNALACNELLVALRKSDMRFEFKKVFDKLRTIRSFEFNVCGYNICIHAFGCWGYLDTSLALFKEMKQRSLVSVSFGPDLCTYNSLIHVLCLVGKVNDALIVWEELKGSGHEPDAFTYRLIIQGCCKSYRMDDATAIFNEMEYNGFVPDTIVYNSLLDGLFKARRVIEACQFFDKMVQEGVRASPWTYNILIDGLFRNGRAEASYTLFCDLKKKGQFVDGVTYSIIILQLCKEGLLEEALQLVEEMEARGFVIDLVTVTSLLIAMHKQGQWEGLERLMKHIREGDLVPNVLKWKANMEDSVKYQKNKRKDYSPLFSPKEDLSEIISSRASSVAKVNVDDISENTEEKDDDNWSSSPHVDLLANLAKSTGDSLQPFSLSPGQRVQAKGDNSFDIDMVNTFLSIFLAKGKLSLACKLFEIFSDMGVNPVRYTYNSMLSAFVKKGYFHQAWGIFNEMGEKVCPADIATYNLIIQGLGKMGRADLASSVLEKLMEKGGYLDIVMYNTLMNALGKAGRMDDVNKLFEQMRSSGINPDVVSFNTLIEVHSKAGRFKDAYKFLKMMLDSGCSPNHVTDTILDFLGREIEKARYEKASIMREKNSS